MSADLRKAAQVFAAAKTSFRYDSDMDVYHVTEHWVTVDEIQDQLSRAGVIMGDCDDFASLCVCLGRKLGMPMRFVLCLTEDGDTHLVAEMEGWIFDNRESDLARRDDLPYTWIAISDYAKNGPWHVIAR